MHDHHLSTPPSAGPGSRRRGTGADRRARHQRVDHHRDRRRDDRPDASPGHHHRGGEAAAVLPLLQHLRSTSLPGPAASAMALPLMPEKMTLTRMSTCASPPRRRPTRMRQKSKMRSLSGAGVHHVGGEDEQRHRQQHVAVVQAVETCSPKRPEVPAGDEQVDDRRRRTSQRRPACR